MLSLIFLHYKRYKDLQLQKYNRYFEEFVWLERQTGHICVLHIKLLCKVRCGLQLCVMRSEVVLDILQVINVLQLWHSRT